MLFDYLKSHILSDWVNKTWHPGSRRRSLPRPRQVTRVTLTAWFQEMRDERNVLFLFFSPFFTMFTVVFFIPNFRERSSNSRENTIIRDAENTQSRSLQEVVKKVFVVWWITRKAGHNAAGRIIQRSVYGYAEEHRRIKLPLADRLQVRFYLTFIKIAARLSCFMWRTSFIFFQAFKNALIFRPKPDFFEGNIHKNNLMSKF